MTENKIQIVDDHDKIIGSANMAEVWETGAWHRIVRIMIEDKNGRILLQKRSKHMKLFPGCWDHSAAGHVDDGDTWERAARRELQEELGITTNEPFQEIAYYKTAGEVEGRKLNRFNKLYKVVVPANQKFTVDEHEVSEARWFTRDELKKMMTEHPDQFTDGLDYVVPKYY